MKTNIFFDLDRSNSPENEPTENELIPENVQEGVISSFHELFQDPDFVEKLRAKVAKMWDSTQEMLANATINRIVRLEHGIEDIHSSTHKRLNRLLTEVTTA